MRTSRKNKLGATLLELLTATVVSVFVLSGCVALLYAGTNSWAQGLGKVGAETDAQMAVRTISNRLAEAMSVSVAANGQSLTYELPQTDGNGNYVLPLAWDGVTRTAKLSGSQMILSDGGSQVVIANGVILTDPLSSGGTAVYKPFVAAPGAITQQVNIEVATQWNGARKNLVSSRERETVFCRNVTIPTAN